jgi:hypothetical protein
MDQGQGLSANARPRIRGRPHERTIEREAFNAWIAEFCREGSVNPATKVWFQHRFSDELDQRRALERFW